MIFLVPTIIASIASLWVYSGMPDIRNLDFLVYFLPVLIILIIIASLNFLYIFIWLLSKALKQDISLFGKRYLILLNFLFISIATAIFLTTYVFKHPKLEYNYPAVDAALPNYEENLVVEFNVPVKIDSLKASFSQELKGKWRWYPYMGISGMTKKGVFEFSETLLPNTRVITYVSGINKATDNKKHEYGFVSYSVDWPRISKTSPAEGSENVQRTDYIELEVNTKNSTQVVDWNFSFKPSLDFEVEYPSSQIIRIKPTQALTQGQKYELTTKMRSKKINLSSSEVIEYGTEVTVGTTNFTVAKEPLLSKFKPSGNQVKATEKIEVTFQTEMEKSEVEKNLEIEPKVEGTIDWENDKKFVFTPKNPLPKATKYKVKIKKGIHSVFGGELENDIVSEFTTIGRVKISKIVPANKSGYVNEYSNIEITFDQKVNRESALSKVSVSPGVDNKANWDGNKLTLDPKTTLALGTTYTVKIKKGVVSIDGLDSKEESVFTFTTRPNQVYFDIPIYFQSTSFSCNIFTAKMIIAWKGMGNPSHTALISEAGYNPSRSGDSWTGNPYAEYVGNADGSWGYGTYYPVIQRLLSNRGIGSTAHSGWNTASMANAIQNGRPVIIWRYNGLGSAADISWTASDGTYVYAFDGMHGSVISGFIGPANNPSSFFINDPWLGQYWIDAGSLDYYWSFSNRTALEIH